MKHQQKQTALQKTRTIILAVIDYLISIEGGRLVFDQEEDPVIFCYEREKLQIEKYYQQRRLDRLQQRLARFAHSLQVGTDVQCIVYVKEKTGYDFDPYQDLLEQVEAVVARGEIRNGKEANDVSTLYRFSQKKGEDDGTAEKLNNMLTHYYTEVFDPVAYTASERKKGYTHVTRETEEDGTLVISGVLTNGPKPILWEEEVAVSPDGKRRLRVTQWDDGKSASTNVVIAFPTTGGTIYGTTGIHPDVKASWKNNSTVLIETKTAYAPHTQHKQVRSFDDVIAIEYIET